LPKPGKKLTAADRLDIGEQYIGEVLARMHVSDQEAWPPESLRDLFEEMQSEHLESGFVMATLNRRGVTLPLNDDAGMGTSSWTVRHRTLRTSAPGSAC
jgi:hypothetical protein